MAMSAGKLRRKLRFERFTVTQDAAGQEVETFAELVTRWCSMEPLSGTEGFAAMELHGKEVVRFVVRWELLLKDLRVKDRIKFGTRTFDIKSALNTEERNEELVILAVELVL